MDRRDEDAGAIAWPGFVDILSAVIIMFVFFVMITAIVMYVLSIEHQKNIEKKNEQRLEDLVSEEVKDIIDQLETGGVSIEELKQALEQKNELDSLSEENAELTQENIELESEVERLSGALEQINAEFSSNQPQEMTIDDDYFIILFNRSDITISDDTLEAIKNYIEKKTAGLSKKDFMIKIIACDNPNAPTITISRELSLARSLNIRNALLENNIDKNMISFNYVESRKIQKSYNWVKIGVIKK